MINNELGGYKMKKYIRKNLKPLVLAIVFSTLAAIFAVRVQFFKGNVLDFALAKNVNHTLRYGFLLGLFILFELGFYYLYDRFRGRFAVNSIKEVRFDFFQSLLSRGYPEFLKKKQGEYIAKYTNEMEIIENQYFSTIPLLIEILTKIIMVSVFLFVLDYRLAMVTLILLTTPLYVPKLVEKKLQNAQVEFINQFENHLKHITDWLNGFEVIKNFSIENIIRDKFAESNNIAMEKNLNKRFMGYKTRYISAILSYYSHFIVIIFAAYLVLKGDFTAGDFFVAVGMIDQLSYPIISISYLIQDLISIKPVNKSMLEFINQNPIKQGKVELSNQDINSIEFKNVSFAYDGKEPILKDLDMNFLRNRQYLLKGASGSGKTTSMNLLLNYYEVDQGSIRINDIEVNEIENLNKLITVMRQDAILFEDTLRNNISMYQNISHDKLISTLSKVGLKNYANDEHLDMQINEGGSNLSGGEKRRISLARSLLRETPILILDEPLANLDEKNAKAIESLLLSIKDRTLIIISHQFSQENLDELDKVIEFI